MRRTLAMSLAFALVTALSLVSVASAQEAIDEEAQYQFGFATVHDLIPEIVGEPLENEHHNLLGNGFQATTGGFLVWHVLDNVMDFTDGSTTWIFGPFGIMTRSNDERFDFEVEREQIEQQLEPMMEQFPEMQVEQFTEMQVEPLSDEAEREQIDQPIETEEEMQPLAEVEPLPDADLE